MIAGLAGGVAGAYLWSSHRVLGFLIGALGASWIASAYLFGDAAAAAFDSVQSGANSGTPVTAATLADSINDAGARTSDPFEALGH